MRPFSLALVVMSILTILLSAEEPAAPKPADVPKTGDAVKKELPKLPWHLADIWWEFEAPTPHFESLDMDVTIDRDVPSTINLYVSPCGIGELSGVKFYGGMQTNANGWPSKIDRHREFMGKGGIFSRWGKGTLSVSQARGASDSYYEAADYEGDFVSVRRPFVWSKGTYTWSLLATDTETIDGKDFTWISCFITPHDTHAQRYIGSLRFEGKDLTFWAKHAAFVEVYSTAKIAHSEIPELKVTFGYPRINGVAPKFKKAYVNHPGPGERSGSPNCTTTAPEGSTVVVTVGPIIEGEAKDRKHALALTVPQ